PTSGPRGDRPGPRPAPAPPATIPRARGSTPRAPARSSEAPPGAAGNTHPRVSARRRDASPTPSGTRPMIAAGTGRRARWSGRRSASRARGPAAPRRPWPRPRPASDPRRSAGGRASSSSVETPRDPGSRSPVGEPGPGGQAWPTTRRRTSAPFQGPDQRLHDGLRIDGLVEEDVGTRLDRPEAIGRLRLACQDDHGQLGGHALHRAAGLIPVHLGHRDVEHDGVRAIAFDDPEGDFAVVGERRSVPERAKANLEELDPLQVVVDEQDMGAGRAHEPTEPVAGPDRSIAFEALE